MTITEFWKAITIHYGRVSTVDGQTTRLPREYDPVIGKSVAEFLRGYKLVCNDEFQPLFDQITLNVSANFGRLPDKAQLHTAAEQIKAKEPKPDQVKREPEQVPTNAETDEVVRGLEELLDSLPLGRMHKRVREAAERRDPYTEVD